MSEDLLHLADHHFDLVRDGMCDQRLGVTAVPLLKGLLVALHGGSVVAAPPVALAGGDVRSERRRLDRPRTGHGAVRQAAHCVALVAFEILVDSPHLDSFPMDKTSKN